MSKRVSKPSRNAVRIAEKNAMKSSGSGGAKRMAAVGNDFGRKQLLKTMI